jgi:hypothetical protein
MIQFLKSTAADETAVREIDALLEIIGLREHAVAQLIKHCATKRKVAGSIPDGVTGIFH